MSKSPFAMFGTDHNLEKDGIIVNYGDFRVTLARAGGSNQEFNLRRETLAKPYLRMIQQNTLPQETMDNLNRQLFAETVVKNFEVKVDGKDGKAGEWKPGVPAKDGNLLPFNVENVQNLFDQLPDLFNDIMRVSSDHANYLEDVKGN